VLLVLTALVNGWFIWQLAQEARSFLPAYADAFNAAILRGVQPPRDLPQATDRYTYLLYVILLLTTALWFAYEVPAIGNSGQTLGKRLMGIKVMRLDSAEPVGFGRAFRRWNTYGLPTLLWSCCGLGLLLQLMDGISPLFDRPLRRAFHDRSAKTIVVQLSQPEGSARARNERAQQSERSGGS